jgi:D-alanine-D-alanine ligase
MSQAEHDLAKYVLKPTSKELQETRVLFHTRHATDLSNERSRRVGYTVVYHAAILKALRDIGLKVTPGSDTEMLFRKLAFEYIWFTQVEAPFAGHELLIPCIAACRGLAFLGPPAPMRAASEDKVMGKSIASALGIEVAKHRLINLQALGVIPPGRWVLKPRTGVMSEHLFLVEDSAGWRAALQAAADPIHQGRAFMAEEFVPGLNLTVPVVEGFPADALSVFVENGGNRDNILTEAAKEGLTPGYSSEPYTGPGAAEASAAAALLAAAIAPFDYARFDFRFDPGRKRLEPPRVCRRPFGLSHAAIAEGVSAA